MKKRLILIVFLACIMTACGSIENNKETDGKKDYFDTDKYNTSVVYTIQGDEITKEQLDDLITKLYERSKLYTTESEVIVGEDNEIVVNMLTSVDTIEIIDEITKPASVEFLDEEEYKKRKNKSEYEVLLDSFDIKEAKTIINEHEENGRFSIELVLSQEATKKFEEFTRENIGKPIHILYDEEVLISPIVENVVSEGVVHITRIETMEEAERIAAYIRIGKLPLNLKLKELRQE